MGRYYQCNADTIRQAVVDTISKVLACGRVIIGVVRQTLLYCMNINVKFDFINHQPNYNILHLF